MENKNTFFKTQKLIYIEINKMDKTLEKIRQKSNC